MCCAVRLNCLGIDKSSAQIIIGILLNLTIKLSDVYNIDKIINIIQEIIRVKKNKS